MPEPKSPPILVVMRSHAVPGLRAVGPQWVRAAAVLRDALLASGAAAVRGGGSHWVATFPGLPAAVGGTEATLARVRAELGGSAGPAPLQVVLHHGEAAAEGSPVLDPDGQVWRHLPFGSLHVTETLRRAWDRLAASGDLPRGEFLPQGPGLFRFAAPGERRRRELFSGRWLPYLWGDAECFYCGLTSHTPASCPTRQLPPQLYGLTAAARVPAAEATELCRKALGDPEEMGRRVGGASSAAQLRKDPALALAAAYFDLRRLYQPRFLVQLAFSSGPRWPGLRAPGRVGVSPASPLFRALDCLRVGRHAEVQAILSDGRRVGPSDRFFAEVTLGFLRLEQGAPGEMTASLERAAKLASTREERLYIRLLLSRCFELAGDLDRAQAAADQVLDAWKECPEGLYRHAQLLARQGAAQQAAARIRDLADGDPEYWVVALLDPELGSVAAEVDEVLGELLDRAVDASRARLAAARRGCEELADWLEEGDPAPAAQLATLGHLEERAAAGGYADLLEAADRALGLSHQCAETRRVRLRQLRADVEGSRGRWEVFRRAWKAYPNKILFHSFSAGLEAVRQDLEGAHSLAGTETLEAYRDAKAHLEAARAALVGLEATVRDMAWAQRSICFLRRLTVRFVFFEATLLPLALLLPTLLGAVGAPLSARLVPSLLRSRAVALLGGLLAPALALAWSLRTGSTSPPPPRNP